MKSARGHANAIGVRSRQALAKFPIDLVHVAGGDEFDIADMVAPEIEESRSG